MAVNITWAGVVTGAVASIAGAFLARRGQNLAERQDIARLTRLVEEVRSEFRATEEHTRSLFAKDTATHVKRFEIELPIYRELWNRVMDLDDALGHVRVSARVGVTTDQRTPAQAYEAFRARLADLHDLSRRHEPFYSKEVNFAILIATLPMREIALQTPSLMPTVTDSERQEQMNKETSAIVEAISGLRNAIRERLFADAAAALIPKTLPEQPKLIIVTDGDA